MQQKKYQFVDDVVLVNKDATINSNYFDFYSDTGFAYLYGPSTITTTESKTYTEKGFYDTKKRNGYAVKNSKINYNNRIIEGDSLYFDDNIKFASATNNIKVTDTINQSIAKGHYAEVFKAKDSLFITKRALIVTKQENDSIYMHADKIMMTGKPKNRIVRAYYNAKIYKTDLSGKVDSIHSNQQTGITQLINLSRFSSSDKFSTKRRPILWNIANQMTGDTIHLISNPETEKLDSLLVFNNAFIISKDTISKDGFNQIFGIRLKGLFNDENKLRQVDIIKNAESIFYARNDKQELIGIDKAKSGSISILFSEGDIEEYTRYNQIDGNLYPESKYPKNEKLLKGFDWREDERPLSVEDLFKEDEPLVLPVIKGLEDYVPQDAFFDEEMMERINQSIYNSISRKEMSITKPFLRHIPNNLSEVNHYQIIITILAKMDDNFQLFYTSDNSSNFSERNSVHKSFSGNNSYQDILFDLPAGVFPTNYRIDVGQNPLQNQITIKSLTVRFKKNEVYIPEHLISKYLTPNVYVEFNASLKNYNLKTVEKNYDPYFVSSTDLLNALLVLHN